MEHFSVSEVADKLGVHEKTIRRYINNGLLEAAKIGGQWRISPASLNDFTSPTCCKPKEEAHISENDFCVFMDADYFSQDTEIQVCTVIDVKRKKDKNIEDLLEKIKCVGFDLLMAGKTVKIDSTDLDAKTVRIVFWSSPSSLAKLIAPVTAYEEV